MISEYFFIPWINLPSSNSLTLLDYLTEWDIYNNVCQFSISPIKQSKCDLKFSITDHQKYIQNQEINKSAIAKDWWEVKQSFAFSCVKIISKPSMHEHSFFKWFNNYKKYNSVANCKFDTSLLIDCWKYYIKSFFVITPAFFFWLH